MASLAHIRAALAAFLLLAIFTPEAWSAPGGAKKTSGAETWVELPGVSATALLPTGRRGILHVNAGVEIEDVRWREHADAVMPRIRAACAEAMRDYAARHYTIGAAPDPEQVSRMLQAAVDQALGAPGKSRLYLTNLMVHDG